MTNFTGKLISNSRLIWLAIALSGQSATAQDGSRWYQIEVTVFAHETSNTLQERWPTADELTLTYPARARELDSLLKHLTLEDWTVLQPALTATESTDTDAPGLSAGPDAQQRSDYRLPDAARDAFVALPAAAHDFTQTNRALNESSAYRVLTHMAWRQPVMRGSDATPIVVAGGRQYGDQHELAGTLTIRFNQSRDRVMLDTDLRLARFSAGQQTDAPEQPRFDVTEVFPMQDSRAMRSNEFHYLDHPAMGVLVQVFPYEPPAAPVNTLTGSASPM
ncbi:MAG: hypothetical protein CMQ34_07275 [Gammaproteobacteria bacterium]|nr:hypothetical protein [Gammaproteobacteria bacterium]|tara:strand:- start:382 stop:1212 length:831 start_codon:yes stop_codon:yes gene_type:complete